MKDKYIDGIAISNIDDKISKLVSGVAKRELGGGSMLVAIQNETGDVYRLITSEGMGSYLDIVQGLAKLGLKDLLAEDLTPQKYDSLFIFE
ncbi:MAG: hypothetical protein RL248_1897 [Pseudomonadota bacterium]|jgi:hypothetical protein